MILFKIINKLFITFEKVYKSKYILEKFKKFKIYLGFFNIFYSKFIKLMSKHNFIKAILL